MSFQNCRNKFRAKIRQNERTILRSKMRNKLLEREDEMKNEETMFIEAISQYQFSNQELKKEEVCSFVHRCIHVLSQTFKQLFSTFVIDHHKHDQQYLTSLFLVIDQSDHLPVLNQLNFNAFIHQFLESQSKNDNCQTTTLKIKVILSIISNIEEKPDFSVFEQYRNKIENIGLFETTYLELVQKCSQTGSFIPSSDSISMYMAKQLEFYTQRQLQLVCKVVMNYSKAEQQPLGKKQIQWFYHLLSRQFANEPLVQQILNFFIIKLSQGQFSLTTSEMQTFIKFIQQLYNNSIKDKSKVLFLNVIQSCTSLLSTQLPNSHQFYEQLLQMIFRQLHQRSANHVTSALLQLLSSILISDDQRIQQVEKMEVRALLNRLYEQSSNYQVISLIEIIENEILLPLQNSDHLFV